VSGHDKREDRNETEAQINESDATSATSRRPPSFIVELEPDEHEGEWMPPEEEFNVLNVIMQRFESLEILIARRIRLSEHIDHMKRDKVVATLKLPIQRYREFLEKKLQELVDKIEERHASALSAQAASQAAQAEIAAASAVRTAVAAVIQQCPVGGSRPSPDGLRARGMLGMLSCGRNSEGVLSPRAVLHLPRKRDQPQESYPSCAVLKVHLYGELRMLSILQNV
jgi:hypothetical protein